MAEATEGHKRKQQRPRNAAQDCCVQHTSGITCWKGFDFFSKSVRHLGSVLDGVTAADWLQLHVLKVYIVRY